MASGAPQISAMGEVAQMYGPPSDCKGKVWRKKVCVNVSVNKDEGSVKGKGFLPAA
jgi:hypothetical protein